MASLLLSVAVFLFWTIVGYAVLSPRSQCGVLRSLLLAPVIGLSTTFLGLYLLNRWGWPIQQIAWAWTAVLAVISAGLLWKKRPLAPLGEARRLAAIIVLALTVVGGPMVTYGFNWLSVCNGDMTLYCLCAQRVHDHGYYEAPDIQAYIDGRDYLAETWFFNAAAGIRGGVDQVLAWVMALAGLPPQAAFMPLIVAFHLVLICTSCALAAHATENRRAVWWTGALMACSSLGVFGVVLQLLGQVAGLSLLAACAALLMQEFRDLSDAERRRQGLLLGLVGTTLALSYPEVAPFLVVSYGAYLFLTRRESHEEMRPRLQVIGTSLVFLGVAINTKIGMVIDFLSRQQSSGAKESTLELFRYYRQPSGLGSLWGLTHTYAQVGDPLRSASILVGGLLTIAALVATVRMLRLRQPAALVTATMTGVAVWLVNNGSGFGLFKIAQFVQPFVLATLAVYAVTRWSPRVSSLALGMLLLLGIPGLLTSMDYSRGAPDSFLGWTMTIHDASGQQFVPKLREAMNRRPDARWIVASHHPQFHRLASYAAQGHPLHLPSMIRLGDGGWLDTSLAGLASEMDHMVDQKFRGEEFPLLDADEATTEFVANDIARSTDASGQSTRVILPTALDCSLNHRWMPAGAEAPFVDLSLAEIRNCLLVQPSSRGETWGASARRMELEQIGIFAMEQDKTFPGRRMMGLGKVGLFEVLNPTETVRLALDCSGTYTAQERRELPAADAIGETRVPFGMTGCGAARVFSPPIRPREINGRYYVAFDMNVLGKLRDDRPTGLMALYGRDVRDELRRIVVHARDLSLVSEEEYAQLNPPQIVRSFPSDLAHKDLEFSGVFEDGWLSGESFFVVKRPAEPANLVVRGMVPGFEADYTSDLVVKLDGREVARQRLCPGDFEVAVLVPGGSGRSRIDCQFSQTRPLGPKDPRPAACRLNEIGFREYSPASTATAEGKPPAQSALQLVGTTPDGWITREGVSFVLTPDMLATQSAVVLSGAWPAELWTEVPKVTAELLPSSGAVEPLNASLRVLDHAYELSVAFDPREVEHGAIAKIRFVDGVSATTVKRMDDARELVAHAPRVVQLQPVTIVGGTPDGWITNQGLTLQVPAVVLEHGTRVELRGRWETGGLKVPPGVRAELILPGEDPETVPATLTVKGGRYVLTADWGQRASVEAAEIRVQFDADFSFAERKPGHADTRRLVTRLPDQGEIIR